MNINMENCLYSAQGSLICQKPRGDVKETFVSAKVNMRPNEVEQGNVNLCTFPPDVLKSAIENGCTIVNEKEKGCMISNCRVNK